MFTLSQLLVSLHCTSRLIAMGRLRDITFKRMFAVRVHADTPIKSLQPMPGSGGRSAARFTSLGPAWLSSGRDDTLPNRSAARFTSLGPGVAELWSLGGFMSTHVKTLTTTIALVPFLWTV